MKTFIALQVLTALLAIHLLTGCSFKVETGWHGRTGIDDQTISPEFRASSAKGKY